MPYCTTTKRNIKFELAKDLQTFRVPPQPNLDDFNQATPSSGVNVYSRPINLGLILGPH